MQAADAQGESRLSARFQAIMLCAVLGLAAIAAAMVVIGAQTERRQDMRVLTELLRGHAFLIDSQALTTRQAAAAIGARLGPSLNAAADGSSWTTRGCGGTHSAASGLRVGPRIAGAPPRDARAENRRAPPLADGDFADWRDALSGVEFDPIALRRLAPNVSAIEFLPARGADAGGATWIGEPARGEAALRLIDAADCAANPSGAPVWFTDVARDALALIAPIEANGRRAGYLRLALDIGALRRMNADLALDDAETLLLSGAATIGRPGGATGVAPIDADGDFDPATRRAALDPFARPAGDLIEDDGRLIFAQPLAHAPWSVVVSLDAGAYRAAALAETSGRLGGLIALIAITLVFAAALTRREFIRPAEALVANIMAHGADASRAAAEAPAGWRPYFTQIRDVFRENTEAAAIRRELSIAARMQASILPKAFPGADAAVAAWGEAKPAQEVGGDFFDLFELPDGRIGVMIADVSGKGVPAALFMVLSHTLARAAAAGSKGPAACLAEVNRLLSADNPETMFVTMIYGVVDPATGRFVYANAGHNPPFVLANDGPPTPLPTPGGAALGVFDDQLFEEAEMELAPGATLVLYTDGVTEAMDPNGAEYGEERLIRLLDAGAKSDVSPHDVAAAIAADVDAFAGAAPQADDLTLLVLRRADAPTLPAPAPMSARLGRDLAEIPRFAERLETWLGEAAVAPADAHAIALSLDELMTNAIEYGGGGDGFSMEATVRAEPDRIVATLSDDGVAFDPFAAAAPDLDAPAEDRPIGGLGVHFARTLTDEHHYERRDGRNVVTLVKTREGDTE